MELSQHTRLNGGLLTVDCKMYDVLPVQQILTNRAIAHSRLGDVQEARDDFLMSLQSKVEPRHCIIEDALLCWQVSPHALYRE